MKKRVRTLPFGQYKDLISYYGNGYKYPFDLSLFSTVTRRNLELLIRFGYKFTDVVITRVQQEINRYRNSYFVIGTTNDNVPIVYGRKETAGIASGQTYIYYMDRPKIQASTLLMKVKEVIEMKEAFSSGDNDRIAKVFTDNI